MELKIWQKNSGQFQTTNVPAQDSSVPCQTGFDGSCRALNYHLPDGGQNNNNEGIAPLKTAVGPAWAELGFMKDLEAIST